MTAEEMIECRANGETLARIGARAGLTRQRVEQILRRAWPGHSRLAEKVRARARDLASAQALRVALAALPWGECAVCGTRTQRRPLRRWLCSTECGAVARTTRWLWSHDPEYRARHQAIMRRRRERKRPRK